MIECLIDPYTLPEVLEEPMLVIEYKKLLVEQHMLWQEGRTTISFPKENKPADSRAIEIQKRMDEIWGKLSKENQEYMFHISEILMSEVLGPSNEAKAQKAELDKFISEEIDTFEEGNE